MKTGIKVMIATVILGAMMSVPVLAKVKQDAPLVVQQFALDNLSEVKKDFYNNPTGWGFEDAAEIDRATLGMGMQVYYIDPKKLKQDNVSSLKSTLKKDESWEFIIEVDGEPRTFFTVSIIDGKYMVSGAGGRAEGFKTAVDTFNQSAPNSDAVLVQDKKVRYLLGTVDGEEIAVPDVSGDKAMLINNMDNQKAWKTSEFITHLKNNQDYFEQFPDDEQPMGGIAPVSNETNTTGFMIGGFAAAAMLAFLGYRVNKKRKVN